MNMLSQAESSVDTEPPYLQTLNHAQREAVTANDDALLVLAGAGTGKTTTLAHRVAHLVVEGADCRRILLLTFTRRAAKEMTHRAESIVRETLKATNSAAPPCTFEWAGTFHSIANRLLRQYAPTVGLEPNFSVLDRGDSADLLDVARQELKLSRKAKRFPRKDTCLAIYSRQVNSQQALAECLKSSFPWCSDWEEELETLFLRYVELKLQHQCLDFDDLLLYWYYLMQDKEIAADVGSYFQHVLVDEYQDTNALQAAILQAMKPNGKGLTAVGDDAQSIYSFRAAQVGNILNFARTVQGESKTINLEENYRSSQPILDASNQLMRESELHQAKQLHSNLPTAGKPDYVTVEDQDAECDYVIEKILQAREAGQLLRNQAVLFRNAHHSDRLEIQLLRRKIPFIKFGGLKFLEAAHIKDMLAILKWAENPKNQSAAYRVLQLLPGFGPVNAARCFREQVAADYRWQNLFNFSPPAAAIAQWSTLCELMNQLASESNDGAAWQHQLTHVRHWYTPHMERLHDAPQQREADLEQLELVSSKYASRERFISELTLDPPEATGDYAGEPHRDEDYLILSTVHSAKGQEWDSVYLLNVTDGNFPNEFATGDAALTEEERRLMYVAMTRAKSALHLTVPLKFDVVQQAKRGDKHVYGSRSRFMSDSMIGLFSKGFHGNPQGNASGPGPKTDRRIDIRAKLLENFTRPAAAAQKTC